MIIKGLRWIYLNAEGQHDFQFLGKPLLKPKDGASHEKNMKNEFNVNGETSQLELQLI